MFPEAPAYSHPSLSRQAPVLEGQWKVGGVDSCQPWEPWERPGEASLLCSPDPTVVYGGYCFLCQVWPDAN